MSGIAELLARIARALECISRPQSPWMDADQAAAYLGRGRHRIDAWIRSGEIPSHKAPDASRGILVHKDDLDAFVRTWPSAATTPRRLRAS